MYSIVYVLIEGDVFIIIFRGIFVSRGIQLYSTLPFFLCIIIIIFTTEHKVILVFLNGKSKLMLG